MEERVDVSVVWDELRRLVRSGSTGTLFLTGEDSTAGRIGVKAGSIVFLAYKFSAGRSALPLLQNVRTVTYRFEDKAPGPLPNMPSTEEILAALVGNGKASSTPSRPPPGAPPRSVTSVVTPAAAPAAGGSMRAPSLPASAPVPGAATTPPNNVVKTELARLLAEYMGPIAPLVFDEHWAKVESGGLTLDGAIESLAKELGGPRASEFRAKALAKIR